LNVAANTTTLVLNKAADGLDANFTLDGVPLKSGTNTVSSAIPGVTMNLQAEAPQTTVSLTVSADTAGITQAINAFVSAYNTVMGAINAQFKVDANNNAGLLASNSAVRSLQSSLLSDVSYAVSGNNGVVNLATMGINMANDGTLSVDSTKLNAALSDHLPDVQNLFQSVAADGFGSHFNTDLNNLIGPASGQLTLNIKENSSNQQMLTRQINDFEDRLTARRQQLINQYSAIDTMLRQYPVLMQQITGQLGSLPTVR
jgi:flagellar hook-associated protein 2